MENIYESNILIIDDLEDNIELIADILEGECYSNIYRAKSAKKGMEILKSTAIDLIVLDVMMPDVDGIEACKAIRDNLVNDDVCIIVATANQSKEIIKRSFDVGANDFIKKPFVNEFELVTRIKNLLTMTQKHRQLKLKEDEIIENQRIMFQQSKMAAMGEMLANIAHQWRQPLSAISTAASGMRIKHEANILTHEDILEFTTGVVTNAKYLSQIIDDFRDFNTPNRVKEEVDLNALVESKLKLIGSTFRNSQVEVINEMKSCVFKSFKNELFQVMVNIMNNAKDALEYNNIQNRIIKLERVPSSTHMIISIKDNALGIDEDILEQIFNPYFTTKHKSQGTGLGLYMSKVIVEKNLGGELKAKNVSFFHNGRQEYGAEFLMTLPLE